MARKASLITCSEEAKQTLERLAASRTEAKQTAERAQIILGCVAGERVKEVARRCHPRRNTVIKWRVRFAQHGLQGLEDAPRPSLEESLDFGFRASCRELKSTFQQSFLPVPASIIALSAQQLIQPQLDLGEARILRVEHGPSRRRSILPARLG